MFSPKTTKQINKLEEIDEILQIVRHELQPEIEKRIEQETLKCLKRKYPDQIQKINKKSRVKKAKVIILIGGIGVGKTIFEEKFAKYLEDEGFRVYCPIETSLKIKRELDLFYKNIK
ncbi:10409_t:CDS:2, partial [Scutellospora calospora]